MSPKHADILRAELDGPNLDKLLALKNAKLHKFVAEAIELCKPGRVFVGTDADEDVAFVRQLAIDNREEIPLAIAGHTVHFDGFYDQSRDPPNTKYLLPEGLSLGESLNSTDRDGGLAEVRGLLAGTMAGRTMLVRFFCLGPTGSVFSIPCVQITDSTYVAHSEDLLYRGGYENFRGIGESGAFFRYLHSQGRLGENNTSTDVEKRRIYIDIAEDCVYSVNTQYGGNTIGLKKLALRLAIRKGDREGWLAEHMLLMGVHGPGGRKTYFAGAFPSGCGKTSTAMLPGESIVGDDIAYFRVLDGEFRAVNVEKGIFGIIRDVSPRGDPIIQQVLTNPGEVIFSNVLVHDGKPYWLGMGSDIPQAGFNHSGKWHAGKKDAAGSEITAAHRNARYTVSLERLPNVDEALEAPEGVLVGGLMYGGRDSDTSVPVQQAFDWTHGIITMAASLESESTAATLGAEGVRKFNLMSNLDFVAIPLAKYIANNLDFAAGLADPPAIFGTNYYLRGPDGEYLNGMLDKHVWVKWAELRVHGDVEAINTPTGLIPKYADLKRLFRQVLEKDYSEADYAEQFKLRIPENLAKISRIEKIYRDVADTPAIVFETLAAQRQRLAELQAAKGDYVAPTDL